MLLHWFISYIDKNPPRHSRHITRRGKSKYVVFCNSLYLESFYDNDEMGNVAQLQSREIK